ncbi:hypothetical protein [Desulforamulus aquiferis]|uniref:Uncharacterized protein n=1 Tax=Desulforamulus aquiferis TaxID=1397668 RepID=A0AAW7Z9R8_9FIRM|nr:hypothetical protein [Desulforamulus aquiferis]MDO7786067.1 hypothetical protein [Desulforamulus aquiferis]
MDNQFFVLDIAKIVFSVLGGSLLTIFFTSRREKEKLRNDLRIKTTELLLERITNLNYNLKNAKNSLRNWLVTLEIYLHAVSWIIQEKSNSDTESINKAKGHLENVIMRLRENLSSYYNTVDTIKQEFEDFLRLFDTRIIILNKFMHEKNSLNNVYCELSDYGEMLKTHLDGLRMNKRFFLIKNEQDLDDFKTEYSQYYKIENIISNRLKHLEIELQNEFLGRLFKYKIK